MKLNIEQGPHVQDVEITIRCNIMDERLAALVRQIQAYGFSIPAWRDGRSFSIALEDIFYFESIEEKTFMYTRQDVYDCELKLYELEEKLHTTGFCRVSKSVVLNSAKVQSVRPLLGARMEAWLENEEKVLISRHYVPAFKAKFHTEESSL